MAGLGFDELFPRMIPSKTHSIIDYVHAGTNFVAGAIFRRSNAKASAAAFALGGGVLLNALMTDYEYGVFRVWDFKVHGLLDYGVAAASALLPTLLGIEGTAEAKYFHGQGAGETLIAGITDYSDDSGAKCHAGHKDRQEWRRAA